MKQVLKSLLISCVIASVASQKTGSQRRRLKGGKAGKGGKGSYSKATKGKAGKSSSSYSYSMSFGPPSPCCDPSYIEGIVNAAASSNGWTVQDDALQWLIDDSCKCGRTVCWDDARYIQRYILATFYYSTIGDKWETCSQPSNIRSQKQCRLGDRSQYANQNGFRWLTCNNECGWGGLSCKIGDDDTITDDITRMDMAENNVGGQLPEEVAALNELQILSFEENKIGGPIPTEYSGLTNLLLFDFDKNKLDGPLPDFSGMQNIQQIDLTKNELEGTIVGKGLDLLTSLAFLDLSENKFEGFIPAFNSNSLLRLFLNNNSFKGRIDVTSSVLEIAFFQCNSFDDTPVSVSRCPPGGDPQSLAANNDICVGSSPKIGTGAERCPCTPVSPSECNSGDRDIALKPGKPTVTFP